MDTWTEKQLKLMNIGGNKNLKDFFTHYDLNDESVQTKYKTRASEYYRRKVISLSEVNCDVAGEHSQWNNLPG